MNILIACEHTGSTRRAFAALGHNVWSCDLLPAEDAANGVQHLQGDVLQFITEEWQNSASGWHWDMMIAHPDCTYLTNSAEWCYKDKQTKQMREGVLFGAERRQARLDALDFVRALMSAPIPRIAIENPIGCIGSNIDALEYGFRTAKATQYIQPHEYGHDASKKTGLYLKNLASLTPTHYVDPRIVNGLPRWANQTDSGQNRLPPSADRWKLRSATYSGWSNAMATQWG